MEFLRKPWRLVWIFSTVFWSYAEAVETSMSSELKLFKDASFPVLSKVMGRNVTCGAHIPAEFPGPTWTCADLKVNGLRMAYGYHPKVSVDGFCTDTGGRENSGALCRAMLLANQVTKPFWAASISQLTCETTAEKRAIVVEQNRDFYWEDFRPGQGWIINLHCITKPMA